MTSSPGDLLVSLEDSVLRAVESLNTGYAALLRQHLNLHHSDNSAIYGPAIVCMSIAGEGDAALGAATALALLIEAGRLFVELDEPATDRGLTDVWKMPRSLNAGDGFYGLAKDRLAQAIASLPAERGVLIAGTLDAGARAYAEALSKITGGSADVRVRRATGALYPAALHMAGLLSGVDATTQAMFDQMGVLSAARIAELSDEEIASPGVNLAAKIDLKGQQQ